MKGDKNPNWLIDRDCRKSFCIDCGKQLSRSAYYMKSKRCPSCARKVEHNPNWQEGIGKLPYSFKFNDKLKYEIKQRDNYTCQICYKKGKHVHHIDYNKQNCKRNNLITLCIKCHPKTNFNRDYWYAYFTYLMEV
jgi:5-methylcytosine-specific restriction endonuclease McrA